LGLKAGEAEELGGQVEGLRLICDRLEEERKRAVFNEELIKMQLTNILETNEDPQHKHKI
jgi:hypothetical protein